MRSVLPFTDRKNQIKEMLLSGRSSLHSRRALTRSCAAALKQSKGRQSIPWVGRAVSRRQAQYGVVADCALNALVVPTPELPGTTQISQSKGSAPRFIHFFVMGASPHGHVIPGHYYKATTNTGERLGAKERKASTPFCDRPRTEAYKHTKYASCD